MKLFIDTAKISQIKELYDVGIIDGVTTNPSLIKKAMKEVGKDSIKTYIKKILLAAKGTSVSLEVIGTTYADMVAEGKKLYSLFNSVAKNVVIKIPINPSFDSTPSYDGIKAIRTLSKAKIPVNATLIFTPEQALLAAKAGATYVSPFAGRIDDYLRTKARMKFSKTDYYPKEGLMKNGKIVVSDNGIVSGIDLVSEIADMFATHEIDCKIIAASLRNSQQVREAALAGADIATVPYKTIKELLVHEKTQEGMIAFTKDIVPEYKKLLGKK